jgi:hypothetical protein
LQNNLLSAILIEDVDKELMRYPPEMAWDLLIQTQSNPLISMQPAWREHYPALFEKYRARLFEYHEEQKDLTAAIKKRLNGLLMAHIMRQGQHMMTIVNSCQLEKRQRMSQN